MKLTFGEPVGGTRLSMSQDEALVLIRQIAAMVQDCNRLPRQPHTESAGVINENAGRHTPGRVIFTVWPNGRDF